LLSTTHWAGAHERAADPETATEHVRAWSPRKERIFTAEHVEIAWERLDVGGWLSAVRTAAPV